MHFDFMYMHHLLGPCVMQLISCFTCRFGVIKYTLLSRPRRNKNKPWTTRRRTPVVAVVMLLLTTLGSKWNPSMVAQPVSINRPAPPQRRTMRAGIMTRTFVLLQPLSRLSATAHHLPRDVARLTRAARSSRLSAAGASTANTRQACRRE